MKYHRILTYVAAATIGLAVAGPTYAKEERKKECAKVEQRGCGGLEAHVRQKIGERIGKIRTIGTDLKELKQYKFKNKKQNAKYQASVDSIIENYTSLYTFSHRRPGAKPEGRYHKEGPKKPDVHKHDHKKGKPEGVKYDKGCPKSGKPEEKRHHKGEHKHGHMIPGKNYQEFAKQMKAKFVERIENTKDPEQKAKLENFLEQIEKRHKAKAE
jgi:hypothetical protein|tara:strand:- start:11 stop:649 length:639 start_codon:yes stop_codon:yes gene_type:complete